MRQLSLFGELENNPLFLVRPSTDIVSVASLLGDRLDPRPLSGKYKALCLFHQEKTPSFFVRPACNDYICYGCKAKGGPLLLVSQLSLIRPDIFFFSYESQRSFVAEAYNDEIKRFERQYCFNLDLDSFVCFI
ncbi:MAG TPA: CHC2 zinc finger domain-containing protein [Candidatus Nanoarchaeia archaeon]|nr:CHC2 zinc finger domain-containing protein [Candidatus Nanoarchaeia archaeon]